MLKKTSYVALGLMSGTSLDGVDLALCQFNLKDNLWDYKLISASTVPYPTLLKDKLEDCIKFNKEELLLLDKELGSYYADIVQSFLSDKNVLPEIIASHGHTVFHNPEENYTLQIGNGEVMASETGIVVVNDFRSLDVSLKGQGAPLVPVGDKALFSAYNFCLNLGGFSNISYEADKKKEILACDISPCNMALNMLTEKLGKPYDNKGMLARSGEIDDELLLSLNSLNYYKEDPPKSLGKEWFRDSFLPIINSSRANTLDLLRTTTEHIAIQISSFVNKLSERDGNMLITGGGAYNSFLLERIENNCTVKLVIPDENLIDYKEALIFAYLGILRIREEINVLASVTGALRDSSSGLIHKPK